MVNNYNSRQDSCKAQKIKGLKVQRSKGSNISPEELGWNCQNSGGAREKLSKFGRIKIREEFGMNV